MILSDEVARIKNEVAEIGIKTMYGLNMTELVEKIIFELFGKE